MIRGSGNFRLAVESLRSSKWRSMLTMLGIIIGVVSVVTTVSLGEGARQGVLSQIRKSGDDLITIRPGIAKNRASEPVNNFFGPRYAGTLSESDYSAVRGLPTTDKIAPFSYVSNSISKENKTYNEGLVIGTSQDLPNVLGQKIRYGSFFKNDEAQRNTAVIGTRVAERLFGENVPIGKYFTIRGKPFIVQGIFDEFIASPLSRSTDFNTAVFIQFDTAKEITGSSDIYQILARPSNGVNKDKYSIDIQKALLASHGGQSDFTIQNQSDKLSESNEALTMMTSFVAGIAAISLIVGGIGILNIMLVSVTERTREIGIRKAIGATTGQILNQFLFEAILLSICGGIIGLILSLLANYLFRIFTELTPIITWPIMVIAFLVSMTVGIIFGVTPALTAAQKRPIDALRYE